MSPRPPEIPDPVPPRREPPVRTEPPVVPTVGGDHIDVLDRLFEHRRIMVAGPLDHDAVTDLCTRLMALDADGGRPVEVIVNSEGGPMGPVLAVLDVFEVMGAAVDTTCIGAAAGTAAVLLSCGTGRRRCAPHATVSLRCDRPEAVEGTASDVARFADQVHETWQRVRDALVAATGRSADAIAAELDHGSAHDAEGALELGLVDEVVTSRRR